MHQLSPTKASPSASSWPGTQYSVLVVATLIRGGAVFFASGRLGSLGCYSSLIPYFSLAMLTVINTSSSPVGAVTIEDGAKATTAAPIPTNTQGESDDYCGQWYTIAANDTCASASLAFGISVNDFYFLNPQVDASCSNLWLGYAYCVRAVGDIATYSGYPITVPATTFTRPPTATETTTAVVWPSLSPRASGTIDGCVFYEDAWPESVLASNPAANSCASWASFADVTVDKLVEWNPSLDAANCVLQPGYSYCIQSEESSSRT